MIPNGKNSENDPKGNQMTTLTATPNDITDDERAELVTLIGQLDAESQRVIFDLTSILLVGGAAADELRTLFEAGNVAAVLARLAARGAQ